MMLEITYFGKDINNYVREVFNFEWIWWEVLLESLSYFCPFVVYLFFLRIYQTNCFPILFIVFANSFS